MVFLQSVLALLVTLGVLIVIHELGHYVIARWSGVKITRFSIGFGRPLFQRTDQRGTEWVVAWIPLGGYVRMLDDRDENVAPEDLARSHNRLSPAWRIAIALGGPVANFLLAIVLFWLMFVVGVTGYLPVFGGAEDSIAQRAGLVEATEIVSVDGRATANAQQVLMALSGRLGDSGEIELGVRAPGRGEREAVQTLVLPIDEWLAGDPQPDILGSLGLVQALPAMVGRVVPGEAAAAAGLQAGDLILSVDGQPVTTWGDWVTAVRSAPGQQLKMELSRDGSSSLAWVTPGERKADDGTSYGFVGVELPRRVTQHGILEAIPLAIAETGDKIAMTFGFIRKMLTGQVSTRTLAGPITIADVARGSMERGLDYYIGILGLLSVSLGILNLLPIPILDGGQVMFALAEMVRGKPLPETAQLISMQIGIVLVAGLTILALFNDFSRLLQ